MTEETINNFKELEHLAAIEFIDYFSTNFDDKGITFHACCLEDAIREACFTSIEKRNVLLLYLHNKNDTFAKIFSENLVTPEVKDVISKRFFLLGWNLEEESYHEALIEALSNRSELSALVNFVKSKTCAALLIVPIKNSFTLFSCMKNKVSKKDFLETLKRAKEFLVTENDIEKDLEKIEDSVNDFGSVNYQQLMLDGLGDRDYDNYDHFEIHLLKQKIGYALFGPPVEENGYDKKQMKKINSLSEVIVNQNNRFAKWTDRVILSIIYNCTEPLPSVKQKRKKNTKYEDYNPNTDLTPVPIFILRKCKNSDNPCRVIIDDGGRVYRTWNSYLTENKLPECEMILPLNGRYQADERGRVILERHLSPVCGVGSKILQGTDIANTAAGIISGGIFIAAAIPAITVAPVALVAAGATGLGVGLYSLGRSAYTLYDRKAHKETISFANSEARGAYLNIVAGSLGFVGAGANIAISQLAAKGFNIGQGATVTVNMINVANIGASGISVANSGYDVFDQWWSENQTPSMLTIIQLSSSILFFGHAVYNFKSVGAMVEESQARTLKDYQDSLRSNRHRKTFNKMMKETIRQNNGNVQKGQAEVIKTVINIPNKDEVFATLTRLNKQMNKNNVKFSANNGDILLNGVSIDIAKFNTMDSNEVATFLTTLPATPEPSPDQIQAMSSKLQLSFRKVNKQEIAGLAIKILRMFSKTDENIKEKIINAVAAVISRLIKETPGCFAEFTRMFPGLDKYLRLVSMVNSHFQQLIDAMEEQYKKWLATKNPDIEEPIFVKLAFDYSRRVVQLFDFVTKAYFMGNNITEVGLRELIKYFYTWFAKQAIEYDEYMTRKQERRIHSGTPKVEMQCPDCGGVYYLMIIR
ncbi:uncharacterized protein LOC100141681 [Tribolium castaneum]|nr:PREDICTED: uncharacterized protein LOC100141681 [Tribolium castaneum]|eukprot:XP_001807608.2 PREDICTED: uncharacterized protein LOC100141681 [Tribolium castaneum]